MTNGRAVVKAQHTKITTEKRAPLSRRWGRRRGKWATENQQRHSALNQDMRQRVMLLITSPGRAATIQRKLDFAAATRLHVSRLPCCLCSSFSPCGFAGSRVQTEQKPQPRWTLVSIARARMSWQVVLQWHFSGL